MTAPRRPPRASLLGWLEERFNLTEMFSFLTNFGLFPAELDSRRPLREALGEALARPMPSYARWPRVLGILSVLLFAFLCVTGVMLAFYYQPAPGVAHASVTTIVRDVSFGWFVHQVHRWAAELLLLILLLRMLRFFVRGMYRRPREGLWILSILLFLAACQAHLTGGLLPWSARGYWSTVRALEVIETLPLLGPAAGVVLGGTGPEVDALVLIRFNLMHLIVWPNVLAILFFLNFSGVRRVGLSALPGETVPGRWVFRVHIFNLLILSVLILGVLVTLATLLPEPFDVPADPFSTPPGTRPPWYLLASHAFLELFPTWMPRWARGVLLEGVLLVCLMLPFLDRSRGEGLRARRVALAAGLAVIAAWLVFTWLGWRMEAAP